MAFSPLDWTILVVYVVACFYAGIYCKKFIGNTEDFLVAGRRVGLHLGVATLAATEIGTVTFMYYSELGYRDGFAAFIVALLSGLVMIFIGQSGFMVQTMRGLNLMTVPEYCQNRYSKGVRLLAGVLVALGGLLNTGVFLKTEATFLTIFTGIPERGLLYVMVAILLLEMLYSVLGGMVSIVITDFIQYIFLSVATILISILTVKEVGWGHIVQTIRITRGANGFNPLSNPDLGWTFIVWQVLAMFASYTCWPTTAMRAFSMKSKDLSRRLFTWSGFIFMGRGMLPMLWGVAALAALGPQTVPIDAMPAFVRTILGSGVRGLVLAGMIAATMSVNSSYLLAWSGIISQDIIMPLRRRLPSEKVQVLTNRIANVFVSLFLLFWSIFYTPKGDLYMYLYIAGTMFLAGTFACVFYGLYWRRASSAGAYAALIGGAFGSLGNLVLGIPASYAGFAAFSLAAAGMIIGSLMWPTRGGAI
jgi:solute:Na+ symporter, SSS family